MKVTDYIAAFLEEQQVSCVFELVGGMITHLVDSLHQRGTIKVVSCHHEQGAAFAAEGYGRITGIPGVAMATSGPGATNLLTGIGSCYFDSTPAVFITGQVNRNELKGDWPIRQLGFQETDIVSMVKPITKAVWQAKTAEEIPDLLKLAFEVATSGRPGPVLLDIPMDIQNSSINPPPPRKVEPVSLSVQGLDNKEIFDKLFDQIKKSKRPLILAGGGIRSSHSTQLFRSFVNKMQIPVVNSLMGVDLLPSHNPFRVGMIGSYGNRWANIALHNADYLLVLGSRLDVRQTGSETGAFKGDKVIYHVDVEAGEINNRVLNCVGIISELAPFLAKAIEYADSAELVDRKEWIGEIAEVKRIWPDTNELPDISGINPNYLIRQISMAATEASAFVVDVGQHQMWAAQSIQLGAEQRFFTSGGMGSMGFALPAAIGTAYGANNRAVVLIAGDGGFQCNIQELQTVVRSELPIKMVILNNGCHGMVRQFQQSYFKERYQSTLWGYSAPDFEKVSLAYGIPARTLSQTEEINAGLNWLFNETQGPALLQVMIDTFANAYPKMAFGLPISEMEPYAKPIAMENT